MGREHFMPRHRGLLPCATLARDDTCRCSTFLGLRVSLGANGRCQRRSDMPPPNSSEQIFRARDPIYPRPIHSPLPTSHPQDLHRGLPPTRDPTHPNFPRQKRTARSTSHILFPLRQWRGRPRARLDEEPPLLFPTHVGPRFRVACRDQEGGKGLDGARLVLGARPTSV